MNAVILHTIITCLTAGAGAWDDGAAVELRYTGTLERSGSEAAAPVVKRFTAYCQSRRQASGGHVVVFVLDERGRGNQAWPERFGELQFDDQHKISQRGSWRLLYQHEAVSATGVPLPLPLFEKGEELKAGAKWTSGRESYEVIKKKTIESRACWQIDVALNIGHKRSIWVEQGTPLVVAVEERVFVGQGEEYNLKMQLESLKPLDEKEVARLKAPWDTLRKLKSDLKRGEDEVKSELSDEQLQLAAEVAPRLDKEAADTPFGHIASVITKDVKSQLGRSDEVAKLAKKLVGQSAPDWKLVTLDKLSIDSKSLRGKIVVLHFWSYQGEPLEEPYGQVGYLDFLYGKRRKLGVEIIGVAVDGRLSDPQTAPAAVKSFQKLRGFMNLSYPLATDPGSVLDKFGDPRRVGAKLPLWIVIDAEGKVAQYQAGFFSINPDEGLRDLDELLVKLIRQAKAKSN
jgi:peroxiredoxin